MNVLGILFLATWAPMAAEPRAIGPTFCVGDEMVYTGEVTEECTRHDRPYKRKVRLDVRVFALSGRDDSTDLAILTRLCPLEDPSIAGAAASITGLKSATGPAPAVVRLELVRVDARGAVQMLRPKPFPPFVLDDKTTVTPVTPLPLNEPATTELGFFVPLPATVATIGQTWTIDEPTRPARQWEAKRTVVQNGAQVVELSAVQRTAEWEKPTGLDKAWQRTDDVFVSPVDGLAREFTRVVERKEGIHIVERRTVRAEMTTPPTPHRGESFASTRREIESAYSFARDYEERTGNTARLSIRIEQYRARQTETAYRDAIDTVLRRIHADRDK